MKGTVPQIKILTEADVPLTLVRRLRKHLKGTIFSRREIETGGNISSLVFCEAWSSEGTTWERPSDRQLLALPRREAGVHFTVKHILQEQKS